MKIKLVSTETTLENKVKETNEAKKILEKEVEELKKSSDDVNLMRLRKAHSELKKEYEKSEEAHRKGNESLRKEKIKLEE